MASPGVPRGTEKSGRRRFNPCKQISRSRSRATSSTASSTALPAAALRLPKLPTGQCGLNAEWQGVGSANAEPDIDEEELPGQAAPGKLQTVPYSPKKRYTNRLDSSKI